MKLRRSFVPFAACLVAYLETIAPCAAGRTLTVASDESGEYKTVQAAVDAVPDGNKDPVVIHIKPGTYKEKVVVLAGQAADRL